MFNSGLEVKDYLFELEVMQIQFRILSPTRLMTVFPDNDIEPVALRNGRPLGG